MRTTRNFLAIAVALLVSGCGALNAVTGSGKLATESRTVSGFNSVELDGSGKLAIEQGQTESLTITADDNLLPYLTSDVSDGQLTLGTKGHGGISPSTAVLYKLSVKNLNAITLSGSGSVNGKGLTTDSLKIVIGGSGEMTLAGAAEMTDVVLAGSGNYKAEDLQSKDVRVQIMGSGDAVVAAGEKLDVMIAGSGSVQYIGDPAVTSKKLGSGSVTKKR